MRCCSARARSSPFSGVEWDTLFLFRALRAAEWNKCQIIPPHFVVTGKHASSAAAAEPAFFSEQYSTLPDNNESCVKRWREASTSWVIGNYRSNPTRRHVKMWMKRGEISTIGRGSSSFVCALMWRWSWEIIKSFRHRHFFLSIPFFFLAPFDFFSTLFPIILCQPQENLSVKLLRHPSICRRRRRRVRKPAKGEQACFKLTIGSSEDF